MIGVCWQIFRKVYWKMSFWKKVKILSFLKTGEKLKKINLIFEILLSRNKNYDEHI